MWRALNWAFYIYLLCNNNVKLNAADDNADNNEEIGHNYFFFVSMAQVIDQQQSLFDQIAAT